MPENTHRGPGRPRVNPENLSERFMIRCTPEQKALFSSLAASDRRSLSAWGLMQIEKQVEEAAEAEDAAP